MRSCDTRWNSHYGTIVSIIVMFEAVVEVVEWIKSDRNQDNLGEATRLFKDIQTFDFAFKFAPPPEKSWLRHCTHIYVPTNLYVN